MNNNRMIQVVIQVLILILIPLKEDLIVWLVIIIIKYLKVHLKDQFYKKHHQKLINQKEINF